MTRCIRFGAAYGLVAVTAIVFAWSSAHAQAPAQQQPSSPPATQAAQPMHWAAKLGLRSWQVTRAAPLVDRIVLVPDAATYVDEISKWSARGRWPVLIEDDQFTAMFVRRFQPSQLIRRDAVADAWPDDPAARRAAVERAVTAAFGGDPARQSPMQAFAAARYVPPGIVVASMNDPAWTAALALAAGHAQPLVWIDDDFGPVDGEIDDAPAQRLQRDITVALDGMGVAYAALGDDVDTITLCRAVPVGARIALAPEARTNAPPQHADGPVALSDWLGRNPDGSRWAFTGWIFGDEVRCAYMAMCSLFLPRDEALLLNTYSSEGEWGLYGMDGPAELFTRGGLAVQARAGERDMSLPPWLRMLIGGVSADVIWMNTSGNADFFQLVGSTARPGDVPVLNRPAAVHLIHSWSMRAPSRSDTVGGRWLRQGAYAAVGSCHEPFLSAFVPPANLAARCMGGVPLLVAARRWTEDGLDRPWRVVTIGDPLMLMLPTGDARSIQRVSQPPPAGDDLLARVKTLMRDADSTGEVNAFVDAIHILDMLGHDEIVVQMWRLSNQKGLASGRIAAAALPALFRLRDVDGFAEAWDAGGPRTPLYMDMLWHLTGPRLSGAADRTLIERLELAIRPDMPPPDVERLAPSLLRAFGPDHLRESIEREIRRTREPEYQRQLREIAAKF